MPDASLPPSANDPIERVREAERLLQRAPDGVPDAALLTIRSTLDFVEIQTPGGAPLHSQLDAARRWLGALADPQEHQRFGGMDHLRHHLITQLRLVTSAIVDYQREMK